MRSAYALRAPQIKDAPFPIPTPPSYPGFSYLDATFTEIYEDFLYYGGAYGEPISAAEAFTSTVAFVGSAYVAPAVAAGATGAQIGSAIASVWEQESPYTFQAFGYTLQSIVNVTIPNLVTHIAENQAVLAATDEEALFFESGGEDEGGIAGIGSYVDAYGDEFGDFGIFDLMGYLYDESSCTSVSVELCL